MKKHCYNCKYWTECSHNHGSAFDGYCYHPSTYNKITDGEGVCCNWEDEIDKEKREVDMYLNWLIKNSEYLTFEMETHRHLYADIIYTVKHKGTNQSIKVCKESNSHYNIIEVNGYDVKNRYLPYNKEISKVFNYIDSFVKKACDEEDDKIQQAIDSFKV